MEQSAAPQTYETPSVLSILICDSIITEAVTNKKTLVGIFDSIKVSQLPVFQRVGFYFKLTDLSGKYRFTVRIVKLDGEQLLGGLDTNEFEWHDPLSPVHLALNLPPLQFKEFGRYEFQLLANDVYLGRATVNVTKMEVA